MEKKRIADAISAKNIKPNNPSEDGRSQGIAALQSVAPAEIVVSIAAMVKANLPAVFEGKSENASLEFDEAVRKTVEELYEKRNGKMNVNEANTYGEVVAHSNVLTDAQQAEIFDTLDVDKFFYTSDCAYFEIEQSAIDYCGQHYGNITYIEYSR